MLPCGTPHVICMEPEIVSPTLTFWVLSLRYDLNHSDSIPINSNLLQQQQQPQQRQQTQQQLQQKEQQQQTSKGNTHKIYYKNQYSSMYKTDERILRKIVKNNISCTNSKDNIKLIIYYKSNLTYNLLTQNNQSKKQVLTDKKENIQNVNTNKEIWI